MITSAKDEWQSSAAKPELENRLFVAFPRINKRCQSVLLDDFDKIDSAIQLMLFIAEETIAGKVTSFVSRSLKDTEKAFIPPIVHCRILTECFSRGTDILSKIQGKLQAKSGEMLKSLLDEKFGDFVQIFDDNKTGSLS